MNIRKLISNCIVFIEDRWHLHVFPTAVYLKAAYLVSFGRRLNLHKPLAFTEKLQWMKKYDRNCLYTKISDKENVKIFIRNTVGERYVIPSIGCWENLEDIQIDKLPNRFVMKCTHDCESTRIIDKTADNWYEIKKRFGEALKKNYYYVTREWSYKNVPPQIIAEPVLQDHDGKLWDYKFFCFDGKVKFFKIDFDRFDNHRANYYNREGEYLNFGEAAYPRDPNRDIVMPKDLSQMIEIAEKLSNSFYFLRVDMYYIDSTIKVGELTLYPGSGLLKYDPDEWDYKIGELLHLPKET